MKALNLQGCVAVTGDVTPHVVVWISNIRARHGKAAVDLRQCGPLSLVEGRSGGAFEGPVLNLSGTLN